MSHFYQALASLLPTGFAWPRDPNSVLMRLVSAMADVLAELHDYTHQAVREWLPHSSRTRLAEWEAATALPDPCFGATQTMEERRARLLARLRGPQGFYTDSSPAAPGAIAQICANMGFEAQVQYNTPFRCGRDRVGRRLGLLDGKLYVVLTVQNKPFRCGKNRVGDRLVASAPGLQELVCALDKYIPARFSLNVILD